MLSTLGQRNPAVPADRLLAELVPPPRFADVRFQSYLPDAAQPTQHAALAGVQAFARRLNESGPADLRGRSLRRRFRRSPGPPESRIGVYLDGGFGVGKTHLLASLWHVAPAPKVFATFVELTHLVGALGFAPAVEALSRQRLVAVDEFELDDPGDTVLVSTLLGSLSEAGVFLAATSNTLPDRLGEGRFAAQDFLREIQGLAAHFDVIRIDGEDYRHRGLPEAPPPYDVQQLARVARDRARDAVVTIEPFGDLVEHLGKVHPSRYGAMLDGVDMVCLQDVRTMHDQASALRMVVLADRLYDRDLPIITSGVPLDRLFAADMMTGGYRKKYSRAISRLVALAREGEGLAEPELPRRDG